MLIETALVRLSMPGGVGGRRRKPPPTRLGPGVNPGNIVSRATGIPSEMAELYILRQNSFALRFCHIVGTHGRASLLWILQ